MFKQQKIKKVISMFIVGLMFSSNLFSLNQNDSEVNNRLILAKSQFVESDKIGVLNLVYDDVLGEYLDVVYQNGTRVAYVDDEVLYAVAEGNDCDPISIAVALSMACKTIKDTFFDKPSPAPAPEPKQAPEPKEKPAPEPKEKPEKSDIDKCTAANLCT